MQVRDKKFLEINFDYKFHVKTNIIVTKINLILSIILAM